MSYGTFRPALKHAWEKGRQLALFSRMIEEKAVALSCGEERPPDRYAAVGESGVGGGGTDVGCGEGREEVGEGWAALDP